MTDRKALDLLVLIMALSTIVVGALVFGALYQSELDRYRRDIVEAARAHAATLAEQQPNAAVHADPATGLPSIHRSLHETGRLLVGRMDEGRLVLAEAASPPGEGSTDDDDAPAALVELMQHALAGDAGTASVSAGSRPMLAAYEPVAGRALGVVATIDTEEVRARLSSTPLLWPEPRRCW